VSYCNQYPFAMPFLSLSLHTRQLRFLAGVSAATGLNWWLNREAEHYEDERRDGVARVVRASSWLCLVLVVLNWAADWLPESANAHSFALHSALLVYVWIAAAILLHSLFSAGNNVYSFACGLLQPTYLLALLLLRDGLSPPLLLICFIAYAIKELLTNAHERTLAMSLLVSFGFYFLGHQPSLTLIPWTAAFIGVPGNFGLNAVPGLLVLFHLFITSILVAAYLLVEDSSSVRSFSAFSAFRSVLVCLAAIVHRRHLMVWKIFAPHFIYESISLLILHMSLNVFFFLARKVAVPD